MMKFLCSLVAFSLLVSCGSDSAENGLENNFHIEGTIKNAANQEIRIEAQAQTGAIIVAKGKTESDGSYEIEGNIPGMGIYSMTIGSDNRNAIALTLEKNDQVTISGDLATFAIAPMISGTRWAKPLTTYMLLFNRFAKQQMEITMKETDPNKQLALFEQLRLPILKFAQQQVNKEPGNPVNIILASSLFPSQESGFSNWSPKNMEVLVKMGRAFDHEHADSPLTKMLSEQIGMIQAEFESYQQNNSGEISAPEIIAKNPSGKELSLSSLKGKVVLVDFWASWCAPCRKENPTVVKMYNKYHAKGFEIFSVSLDQDATAWKTAIQKDGLSWTHHVSDLMGWESPIVKQFGVQGIPYTVLINKEGKIVGVGLRGLDLERKLIEQLAK
jgi:thiol-disulfide isomerase/thioredoxin